MYLAIIVGLMIVLPLMAIAVEMAASGGSADLLLLVGKWFVFWGIGVRLLMAGINQITRPAFTAGLLGLKETSSFVVVRELGFANVALGTLGVLSLLHSGWTNAAAVAGAVFLGLAGINHLMRERTPKETVPMVSDLGLAMLLAAYLAGVALRA